ncbi:MAG: hypothetical protein AB7G48_10550 [Nitrospiraceae bacterium]
MVRLLIEVGADLHLADQGGVTPLQRARRKDHREIAALLNEAGAW